MKQGYLHLILLTVAVGNFPVTPSPARWKLAPGDLPTLKILLLLLATIGIPYLILSATAPLVAHWFVRSFPGNPPYRLYALSSIGSLMALLSYPVVVEPYLTRSEQLMIWEWGFAAFVLCCVWCALHPKFVGETAASVAGMSGESIHEPERPAVPVMLMWLALSACGSAMLLATSNQLCQDVAVVPFLWIIPLTIYLVSFIICYSSDRMNNRLFWGIFLAVTVVVSCRVLSMAPRPGLLIQISVFAASLFAVCMACHGELARSRPHPRYLTVYYLIMATGGAMGGIFVTVLAPFLFKNFWEYPLALTASCLLAVFAWFRSGSLAEGGRWLTGIVITGLVCLIVFSGSQIFGNGQPTLFKDRNFFGVVRVLWEVDAIGKRMTLSHGRTVHGWQYADPDKRMLPTSYYGADSGAGLALRFHPRRFAASLQQQTLRVGVIGLGAGTLATFGRQGDYFRFYEINPAVIWLADNLFSFKREGAASIDIIQGDARIVMEAELEQNRRQDFDVLIVDAFSSDAIPMHLLTRECFAVYRRHLKADGLLLLHITNDFINLSPVVLAQGQDAGFKSTIFFYSPVNASLGLFQSSWAAMAMNRDFQNRQEVSSRLVNLADSAVVIKPWTDDFASLWPVLQ
jgi:hypothetical protein